MMDSPAWTAQYGSQCPYCQTVFKVHPDQMRLHNGYANCGVCGMSFDVQALMLLLPEHQTHFFTPTRAVNQGNLPTLNAQVVMNATQKSQHENAPSPSPIVANSTEQGEVTNSPTDAQTTPNDAVTAETQPIAIVHASNPVSNARHWGLFFGILLLSALIILPFTDAAARLIERVPALAPMINTLRAWLHFETLS